MMYIMQVGNIGGDFDDIEIDEEWADVIFHTFDGMNVLVVNQKFIDGYIYTYLMERVACKIDGYHPNEHGYSTDCIVVPHDVEVRL